MRNFKLTLFILLFAPVCINAQTLAQVETNTFTASISTATNYSTKKSNNNPIETPESARKQVISGMNFSASADAASETNEETTQTESYSEFLAKMEKTIKARIKTLESAQAPQLKEISDAYRALNVLKSAECLSERKDGSFIRQKDVDGQEIVAFNIEQLKSNARYGYVEMFKEGFARIKKDQVYGFLNYCGEEVVACQYENAEAFNNGRALVKRVNWFFIDANGNESDALKNVVDAQALKHGISLVRLSNGKMAFINNKYDQTKSLISDEFDEITPFVGLDVFRVRVGNKFGIMSLLGQIKLTPVYDMIEPSTVQNLYRINQNGKLGMVDNMWKVRFSPAFTTIGTFDANGLAMAQEDNGYRLISNKTFKTSQLYKTIGAFSKTGLAQIQDEKGQFGLIDTELKVVVEPQYSVIGEFNEFGLASACRQEKKCGYINTNGIEIIAPAYEEVESFNKYGVVVVRELAKDKNKNIKTDIVYNKYGQVIIAKAVEGEVSTMKIHYEVLDTLHTEKYIAVKKYMDDEAQGFMLIDAKTFKLLNTKAYQAITPQDINGMLRIKEKNVWGLMDTLGNIVIEPTYAEMKKSTEGYYPVKNANDKYGFVDKKGKVVIPFEYDDVKYYRNGYCIVAKGKEKWGLINKYNAKVVPCVFKSVNVKDGSYEMIDSKDNTYMIDDKGDCLQNCQKFEEIRKKANQ